MTLILSYMSDSLLGEYPRILADLDSRYEGPCSEGKSCVKSLEVTLMHLSKYRKATTQEIINEDNRRHRKSEVDNLKKFIEKNLVQRGIVFREGYRKIYNKNIARFSLTPFGVLYAIHFLSRTRITVNNIMAAYPEVFPHISNNFDFFQGEFGNDVLRVTGIKRVSDGFFNPEPSSHGSISALRDFVGVIEGRWRGYYTGSPDDLVSKQISFCIFNNILSYLINFYDDLVQYPSQNKRIIKNVAQFWSRLQKNDPDASSWYLGYIGEAIESHESYRNSLHEITNWLTAPTR